MMGKSHAVAGALFTAAIAPPASKALGLDLSPEELAIGVGIGAVAGLLPDIDHPDSMLTEGVIPGAKYLGPLGPAIGLFLSIPPRIVGIGARATMNHRGGTHSLTFLALWTVLAAPLYAACIALGAFLVSVVLGALTGVFPGVPTLDVGAVISWLVSNLPAVMPLVMLSVFCGYLSHLVTDSMTNVPVPWPWPFSKKRYSLLPKGMRITTDSFAENRLVRPLMVVLLAAAFTLQIGVPMVTSVADKAGLELSQQEKKPQAKTPLPGD